MRIGIDVGGTNTDAVLMDGIELVAQSKRPTTPDVTSGILEALNDVLAQLPSSATVQAVMLGTTHFTNALVQRKDVSPTGVIRLALPATKLLPPFIDWPQPLLDVVGGYEYMVHGGHEFDGREISTLDEQEVREAAKDLVRRGAEAVAISGVFSPVDSSHEERAAEIVRQEAPELHITLSHEIGKVGILERENAAALNACLRGLAEKTVLAMEEAIASLGPDIPLYLSQNDGTLMDSEFAKRFPVFTIASGPTNSMRGAALLSKVRDAIVVDVGGTSTDIGALVKGFPREASVSVDITEIRTNFRMPDVLSIALGGGSIVSSDPVRIGPESVGYRLTDEALVFGGNTVTATDVAVAGGLARIGNGDRVGSLDKALVKQALSEIQNKVETGIDKVKLSAEPIPVVMVGGGSVLLGDALEGSSEVLRPPHGEVANAIGAAIAQVEKVYSLSDIARDEALASARSEAIEKAVAAGADPATIEVVEVEEVPLTYLPSNATKIRVKAVGDLPDVRV